MLIFCLSSSSVRLAVPTAVPIQRTFFNWNLTVLLISLTLSSTFSFSPIATGNFPILLRVLPISLGICFIKDSEARSTSNGLAHFLINFLSLLNFLAPSTSMQPTSTFLAWSQWTAVPMSPTYSNYTKVIKEEEKVQRRMYRMFTFLFGDGTLGSLILPLKRLSFSGS